MYGGIHDLGMASYRSRLALAIFSIPSESAIGQWGWGFHTVRGGFDPADHRFRPRVVGVVHVYGGIYDPGMGSYRPQVALDIFSSPSQSTIGRWGWGFHTVRGGFDPGDHRSRPQVVGAVDVWKDL